MDINDLYNFIVVVEELSFTKAAKRLFLSQQAISGQIKKLEDECGVPLFTRKPSLLPTAAGISLYKTAIEMLRLHQLFQSSLANYSADEAGEIRLGVSYGRSRLYIPEILKTMVNRCPNLRLILKEKMTSPRMEQAVINEETDFYIGLTPLITNQVKTVILGTDVLLLVVPKVFMNDFRKKNGMKSSDKFESHYSIDALAEYPFILQSSDNSLRFSFSKYTSTLNFTPNIIMESDQSDTLFFMALAGNGIAVYPEVLFNSWKEILSPEVLSTVEVIKLSNMTDNKIILGYKKDRKLSGMDNTFIDICRNLNIFQLT